MDYLALPGIHVSSYQTGLDWSAPMDTLDLVWSMLEQDEYKYVPLPWIGYVAT